MTLSDFMPYVSILIAALALVRNFRGDAKNDAGQMTTVIIKLETIIDNVKDLKVETKDIKYDLEKMKERITIVEQSAKSAHKRIDTLHEEHFAEEQNRN